MCKHLCSNIDELDRHLGQHKAWLADASIKLSLTIRLSLADVCNSMYLTFVICVKIIKGVSTKGSHTIPTWRYV